MTPATPEDIANVIKLLERLRTGELNLMPGISFVDEAHRHHELRQDASTALLQRVEAVLSEHLRRMQQPLGNGGAAFPGSAVYDHTREQVNSAAAYGADMGMSLRDYFATQAPTDEVQELQFLHLSRDAQERITGLKYPEDRGSTIREERIALQLAEFEFKCAVNAAIRYRMADAMLKRRQS